MGDIFKVRCSTSQISLETPAFATLGKGELRKGITFSQLSARIHCIVPACIKL